MNRRRVFRILLAVSLGFFGGLGLFTFRYAEGLSYFSKDPKACVNCHIMQPQYDSWQKASHHNVATCVDCHLPHDLIPKYIAKADNGYRHSKGFTFQNFHEPIVMTQTNRRILQENCLRCHDGLVHAMLPFDRAETATFGCTHCHATVGHGERTGMGRFELTRIPGGSNR